MIFMCNYNKTELNEKPIPFEEQVFGVRQNLQ